MEITAYGLAHRFLGLKEAPGAAANPLILAGLRLDAPWVSDDETAWCSAFVNAIAWMLQLPRSKSLAARSWLTVGQAVALEDARPGWDVVVFRRGPEPQPGPEVTSGAPGHVAFFAGRDGGRVLALGGNQANAVTIAPFLASQVLGVRRLWA